MRKLQKNQSGFGTIEIVIAIVLLIVIVLVGMYVVNANSKPKGQAASKNQLSTSTSSTTSHIANEKSIAFGAVASDGSFQAKLLGVTLSPTVTGDQPDPGTQYLEADFSVTSIANRNNYGFSMHYLPSIVPAGGTMGNIELSPVDTIGGTTNPVTFNQMAAKNVQITGKTSAEGYGLPADGSVKTVEVYTLFEIRKGDKGQVVWQGIDNESYHFLTH